MHVGLMMFFFLKVPSLPSTVLGARQKPVDAKKKTISVASTVTFHEYSYLRIEGSSEHFF